MVRITLLYALSLATVLTLADLGVLDPIAQPLNELPIVDKFIHFSMFGLLALLVNLSLVRSGRWSLLGTIVTGGILVAIVSTGEELSNLLVPNRGCSLGDLAANYLGVFCLGVLPWLIIWGRQPAATEFDSATAPTDAR